MSTQQCSADHPVLWFHPQPAEISSSPNWIWPTSNIITKHMNENVQLCWWSDSTATVIIYESTDRVPLPIVVLLPVEDLVLFGHRQSDPAFGNVQSKVRTPSSGSSEEKQSLMSSSSDIQRKVRPGKGEKKKTASILVFVSWLWQNLCRDYAISQAHFSLCETLQWDRTSYSPGLQDLERKAVAQAANRATYAISMLNQGW